MKKNFYRWQPELSTTIIYWSCTFGILFLSLILTLEHTRPYLVSNIVLGLFFFFVALGVTRYFKVDTNHIWIHPILPRRRKKISFASITKIRVGAKGIEIISTEFSEGAQLYIMTKKTKNEFIKAVEKKVVICYDNALKMAKE